MSDVAIRVEELGKRYRIGQARERSTRLSHLFQKAAAPFGWLATSLRRPGEDELIWALKDVSFEVQRGEVLGIIGRNGAGKSTLLKILSRITEPTEGWADLHGRVGSLLEVGTGFHPELTGRENIYLSGAILGMRKADIDRRFDEIVAFAETEKFLGTAVKRYSSGMYVRLAFAVAAHLEPEILLVDEVLAVGDAAFQKKCLGKMGDVARGGRTVLFVSHNMGAITALCDAALLLDSGRRAFYGPAADTVQTYISSIRNGQALTASTSPIIPLEHAKRRHSSDRARLRWLSLMDLEGKPCRTFRYGEGMRLRICFEVSLPIRVAAEAYLKSSLSERISVFASEHFQNLLIAAAPNDENVIDLVIPHLPLARGRYSLDVGVSIPFIEWLDYVDDACQFDIEVSDPGGTGFTFEQSHGLGAIYIDHSWEPR